MGYIYGICGDLIGCGFGFRENDPLEHWYFTLPVFRTISFGVECIHVIHSELKGFGVGV